MENKKPAKDLEPGDIVLYRLRWYTCCGYSRERHEVCLKNQDGQTALKFLTPSMQVRVRGKDESSSWPYA